MMKIRFLAPSLLAAGLALLAVNAANQKKEEKLEDDVTAAIKAFKQADTGIAKFFESAAGYAVFPNVGKGGLVVGGAHGNGLVYEKGEKGAKLVGSASLSQVTIGAQIGGQEFSEVIFFEDKDALGRFKDSNFEMSAQLSAVAAAEGASKNAKYKNGVMIFTKAKTGLMAEASVGGQKFKFKPLDDAKK
jgi:lipid-binding SYLF domain-containing protein